jgi:hypothetical protein
MKTKKIRHVRSDPFSLGYGSGCTSDGNKTMCVYQLLVLEVQSYVERGDFPQRAGFISNSRRGRGIFLLEV